MVWLTTLSISDINNSHYIKRTGSVPSLGKLKRLAPLQSHDTDLRYPVAGLGVGALYTYSSQRIRSNQPYGIELALLASTALAGSSIPRAIKTGKPLPQVLSLLAAAGLIYYGMK